MAKKKPQQSDKNTILAGLSYLLLFLGLIGLIVDTIIYYSTKNKYSKFHAGQACFLYMIVNIIAVIILFASLGTFGLFGSSFFDIGLGVSRFSWTSPIYVFADLAAIIYIGLAIAAFMGKDFRIPIAAHLLEK